MKILMTGMLGYIGSALESELIEKKYQLTGLDTGYYAAASFYNNGTKHALKVLRKDIRQVTVDDFKDYDAVMHLGELSNDPLGQLNPALTRQINCEGSVRLAGLSKEAGVPRFIYSSSCSVYGIGSGEFKDEQSTVSPQTTYAECKIRVEQEVGKLADSKFSPTFLRNATAYGASPRMRFDLVMNNLSGLAWTTKEIKMNSDGTPWRPIAHIRDIARAFIAVLEAPRDVVHNQVFNVGDTEENYQVRDIAEIVARVFPGCAVTFGKGDKDSRSYRVSFDKIHKALPGFKCAYKAVDGAQELRHAFEKVKLDTPLFEHRAFTRIKQLKYLLATHQINQDLFWNQSPA